MAKKKSSKQKVASQSEFSSSPFKSLKGLSAFTEQGSSAQAVQAKQTKVEEPKSSPADQHSFADEMDFLGVKPLPESVIEEPVPVMPAETSHSKQPKQSRKETEAETFLDAVGSMEKVFKDEWPEDEPAKQAVPRRMRQVERGQLKPQVELDLHGLTIEEASVKVRFFLQDSVHQGFQTVLIITGKGLHSNDGPVLRQAMEVLLNQLKEQVIEWGVAPRRYGGSGALVAFLRVPVVE